MKTRARIVQAKQGTGKPVPNTVNGTVPPARQPNAARRPREYLTPKEIELLRKAARDRSRYGHRDAAMILIAYRHGFRASELCALRWDQVDLAQGPLHVQRLKNGMPSVHPLGGSEIRDLRRLRREQPEGRYVFLTERAGPMTRPDDNGRFPEDAGKGRGERKFSIPNSSAYAAACVRI